MFNALKSILNSVAKATSNSALTPQDIREDFHCFCDDTRDYSKEDWSNLDRLNPDSYISMEQMLNTMQTACGYPTGVTEFDLNTFIKPITDDLIHKMRTSQAQGHSYLPNSKNIRHFSIRMGDVLDVVSAHRLPDGDSFLVQSKHDETQVNTDRIERYLDLKSPLMYALCFAHDQRPLLPEDFRAQFDEMDI